MCFGCKRVWTALQILWSSIYVVSGAAQLIAGIFFLISIPALHLSCNIWTGTWNILIGIAGGTLACLGQMCARRQEFLLYMAATILIVNSINVILSECALYFTDMPKLLKNHPYQTLINYACFATRLATAAVIIVSFLDSQFSYCTMQLAPKTTNVKEKKKLRTSHEQVSDIEYIIPRPKTTPKPQTSLLNNAYAQSWVFDTNDTAGTSNNAENSYLKILENGTSPSSETTHNLQNGIVNNNNIIIDNPVVRIDEASDDSNSNSDRKLYHMRSFSRSTSPAPLSAASSHLSLNNNKDINNPPIYECLEKLTEPTIYRSRLNTALSNKSEDIQYQVPQTVNIKRLDSVSPHSEKVQYASLMKELQKAIVNKKSQLQIRDSTSESNSQTNSKSSSIQESLSHSDGKSNSDTEFSKELEAALQLIQDLESPNTIETPSDNKSFGINVSGGGGGGGGVVPSQWRNSDASGSEKTLSAMGSMAEITSSPIIECQSTSEMYTFKPSSTPTIINSGKTCCADADVIVHHYPESQSTSGYSSPTHTNWSTTSSLNGSNNDMSYTIHCAKTTTVISLHPHHDKPPPHPNNPKTINGGKSITLVNIRANNNEHLQLLKSTKNNDFVDIINEKPIQEPTWTMKSLLRRKKSYPKLCPELEGAIIKSETLAYLSDNELLARHQRNKEIQRKIEERVFQQLTTPRTESNC